MSSPEERKEAARARREQEQAAAHAASRRKRLQLVGGGAAVVVVVAAVIGVLVAGGGDDTPGSPGAPAVKASIPAQKVTDLVPALAAAGVKQKTFKDDGEGEHTTDPVKYPMNPPTNGPHNPVWAADGNYAGRTTPEIEQLVHSLEHGRVQIQYRPGLPAAQVAQLEALFDESPQHMQLFENATGMKGDVAVTAWTHSIEFPALTDAAFDAIRAFRDQYRDQGPEYVA